MDLRFSSPLSLEECTQRLQDAIDPIPPWRERGRSAMGTTWAVSPLPAAGRRIDGFGYARGTRPVVGTLTQHRFRLEKKVVARGRGGTPIIRAVCSGEFTATQDGTQVAAAIQHPLSFNVLGAGCGLLMGISLFSLVTVPLLIRLLFAIDILGTGSPLPNKQQLGMSFCFPPLFLVFSIGLLLTEYSGFQQEARYLMRFLEQICAAPPTVPAVPTDTASAGKPGQLT